MLLLYRSTAPAAWGKCRNNYTMANKRLICAAGESAALVIYLEINWTSERLLLHYRPTAFFAHYAKQTSNAALRRAAEIADTVLCMLIAGDWTTNWACQI